MNLFGVVETVKAKEDMKESIALYGSIKLAENLYSLNVINFKSYQIFYKLRDLSNKHLASILVEKLSYVLKSYYKYHDFLLFLQSKTSLSYLYYQFIQQSKCIN